MDEEGGLYFSSVIIFNFNRISRYDPYIIILFRQVIVIQTFIDIFFIYYNSNQQNALNSVAFIY